MMITNSLSKQKTKLLFLGGYLRTILKYNNTMLKTSQIKKYVMKVRLNVKKIKQKSSKF